MAPVLARFMSSLWGARNLGRWFSSVFRPAFQKALVPMSLHRNEVFESAMVAECCICGSIGALLCSSQLIADGYRISPALPPPGYIESLDRSVVEARTTT